MRSLYQNLKNKSNPSLRKRVLSGEVTPERFVVMTHEELKSAERRAEDAKIQKENMDMAMVAQAERSVSTSLQCGKCGQRKVSYSQAQTRSADEPMTTFCECTICGNRWKVGSVYRGSVVIEEWLVDFGLLVLLNDGCAHLGVRLSNGAQTGGSSGACDSSRLCVTLMALWAAHTN